MANDTRIEALARKVDRLIADNRMLRDELKKSIAAKEKTEKQRRLAEQNIMELEKRVKVLETTGSFIGTREDNRAARLRVNKLIKEIDNCIALINKW